MRMRHKKHGAERIAACSDILIVPKEGIATDPRTFFPETQPVALEIGCGKGDFTIGMAARCPDRNWIAVERVADVACIALEKAKASAADRPDNLRFLIANAQNLPAVFPMHSVDRIYLNFSDPWPKKGYAKRRLTHAGFLSMYRDLLCEGGELRCKTDNEGLFAFTLEQLNLCGWRVEWTTRDLHASEKAADNVMTEYEKQFSAKGQPIFSVWARAPLAEQKGNDPE